LGGRKVEYGRVADMVFVWNANPSADCRDGGASRSEEARSISIVRGDDDGGDGDGDDNGVLFMAEDQ